MRTSPEYRKRLAVVAFRTTRLGKGFSAAFLDDFWSELCKLSAIESDEQFRSGLYLGSQLILALSCNRLPEFLAPDGRQEAPSVAARPSSK